MRFARLIQQRGRVLGGPAVRAASGDNFNLPQLLLGAVLNEYRTAARSQQGSSGRYRICGTDPRPTDVSPLGRQSSRRLPDLPRS